MSSFPPCSPSTSVSSNHHLRDSLLFRQTRCRAPSSERDRKFSFTRRGTSSRPLRLSRFGNGEFVVSSGNRSRNLMVFCFKEYPSSDEGRNLEVESKVSSDEAEAAVGAAEGKLTVETGSPNIPAYAQASRLSLGDQAFFLLAFVACTTSVALTGLVLAAIPTLFAMARAATSLSKLADAAREELPSTMAAIRLSGMEISDLTLELSDLSREIADGVTKSTQAVQAAEAGIRQVGALARDRTISIIQEHASLPINSLQPVVAGAAQRTSKAVGHARRTLMNMISRREFSSDDEDNATDSIEV